MDFMEFEARHVVVDGNPVFLRAAGEGPPLLLLHGFPETLIMWRDIAPILAESFTVVCADLRGYGRTGCPPSTDDHEPYSKRAMGRELVALMAQFGFDHFGVVGHDRGGRVAYRMALDAPDAVTGVAVLDVVPTAAAWNRADDRLALGFWPWTLLAQPSPLPETLITASPEAVIDDAASQWGSGSEAFPPEIRRAYADALRDPGRVHAICEEYRAATKMDRAHDDADIGAGRKIAAPLLALWSGEGALQTWYEDEGGPLALWRTLADNVEGNPVNGGHFFPEEYPVETARALAAFFAKP